MSEKGKHISPFKFLDAYGLDDRDSFFGREKEVEDLYALVKQSKLALIYGLSGTGKTSLVNCGLASRFSENTWYPILVRRGQNINDALDLEIQNKVIEPIAQNAELPEKIESIYLDYYVPIYLIFDQFEELFISGTVDEQLDFFNQLADLYNSKVSCRILIIMREEYLGYFSNFERILPELFESRFRVEKMSRSNLEQVVEGTFKAANLEIQNSQELSKAILENVKDERQEIDLTNLQVYFDRMWRAATDNIPSEQTPVFSPTLVKQVGKLPQVLSVFIDEQLFQIAAETGNPSSKVPLEILSSFVTDDGTKLNRTEVDLIKIGKQLKQIPSNVVKSTIEAFQKRKILREVKIGDRVEFELAHDLLAAQIFNRFSAEERNRREAKNRYRVYSKVAEERLLVKEELETLAPYLQVLSPDKKLAEVIEKSQHAIETIEQKERLRLEKELKRQKRITLAVALSSIAFLALAGFAYLQWTNTQKAKIEISIKAFEAQMNLCKAEKNEGNYSSALKELELAQQFIGTSEHQAIVEKSKNNWTTIKNLTNEANSLYKNGDFRNTITKLKDAQAIDPDERIAELIKSTENELEARFKNLLKKAEAMARARENELAIDNYENAIKLKPNQESVLRPLINRLKN